MALDEKDDELITQKINGIVNGAVATLKKAFETKAKTDAETLTKSILAGLDEKLAAFKPPPSGDDDDGKGGKGGKGGGRRPSDDPEFAALKRTTGEMQEQLRVEREKSERMRARNIDSAVREQVYSELGAIGLDAARSKAAFAAFKIDNVLTTEVDDDGESVSILFKADDGTALPLRDGVRSWAKSDSAKLYLPPTGAGGAGSKRPIGGKEPPAKRELTMEDIGNWAASAIGNSSAIKLGE
jgi:hypothetical protein